MYIWLGKTLPSSGYFQGISGLRKYDDTPEPSNKDIMFANMKTILLRINFYLFSL